MPRNHEKDLMTKAQTPARRRAERDRLPIISNLDEFSDNFPYVGVERVEFCSAALGKLLEPIFKKLAGLVLHNLLGFATADI